CLWESLLPDQYPAFWARCTRLRATGSCRGGGWFLCADLLWKQGRVWNWDGAERIGRSLSGLTRLPGCLCPSVLSCFGFCGEHAAGRQSVDEFRCEPLNCWSARGEVRA